MRADEVVDHFFFRKKNGGFGGKYIEIRTKKKHPFLTIAYLDLEHVTFYQAFAAMGAIGVQESSGFEDFPDLIPPDLLRVDRLFLSDLGGQFTAVSIFLVKFPQRDRQVVKFHEVALASATRTYADLSSHVEIKWHHAGSTGQALRFGIQYLPAMRTGKYRQVVFRKVNRGLIVITSVNGA
jgi:hypothetical protein